MQELPEKDYEKYSFHDNAKYVEEFPEGLDKSLVEELSKDKKEPEWMLRIRLKAFEKFMELPMPKFGPDLSEINFDEVKYYAKPTEEETTNWDEVPEYIKNTFEKLGIPEAERKLLAGVSAQYDSEVVYHNLKKDYEKRGIVFLSMDEGLKKYPEIVRKYFGKLVPYYDNKFAALNTAFWSGGSFVYVPEGVKVDIPLQTYFRMNAKAIGQFERTLIIGEKGSDFSYIEGCTAPVYDKDSLHAAVVEVYAKENSKIRYTTIQNWSRNVYNLVTTRAIAYKNAYVEWIDGNMGSKITMKYPATILKEEGAKTRILSIAYAGEDQVIDAGAKAIHLAKNTGSNIISKSISKGNGRSSYRGWVYVKKGAEKSRISVNCDALLIDKESKTDTFPSIDINEKKITVAHEASVGKISDEQLFYLMNRGLSDEEAQTTIVMGFIEEFTKELPFEYAVELNKLIALEMEGSVG